MASDPSGVAQALTRRLAATDDLVLRANEPLAKHCTFQIGGSVQWYLEVGTVAGLTAVLALAQEHDTPLQILGLGSNILFPDEGLPGIVARLSGDFRRLEIAGTTVTAGAALSLAQVSRRTAQAGLVGLEALSGFPSTVGGAVYMNAGCYGTEIRDVLASAALLDADGTSRTATAEDLEPGYRETNLQGTSTIVTEAVFELSVGDSAAAVARIDELNRRRWKRLPSGVANAGSIFKNPPDDYAGRLVDECALKGRVSGGARISLEHGNVIVNDGGAEARDVLVLMLEMRRCVRQRFDIELVPELILTGSLAELWRADRAAV
jgi:UDP-N-acetylmuramate dehydrogenase